MKLLRNEVAGLILAGDLGNAPQRPHLSITTYYTQVGQCYRISPKFLAISQMVDSYTTHRKLYMESYSI